MYLKWLKLEQEKKLNKPDVEKADLEFDADEEEESHAHVLPSSSSSSCWPPRQYYLVKKCFLPSVSVLQFGTSDFLPTLNAYLIHNDIGRFNISSQINFFPLYKHIQFNYRPNIYTSNKPSTYAICAVSAIPAKGHHPAAPGCFDTIVVHNPELPL